MEKSVAYAEVEIRGKCRSGFFFESMMTAYLNAAWQRKFSILDAL